MSSRLVERLKFKIKGSPQSQSGNTTPAQSSAPGAGAGISFQPAPPASSSPAQPPDPAAGLGVSSALLTSGSSLPSLQEQLWNDAYDEIQAKEPKLIEAYEEVILQQPVQSAAESNPIGTDNTAADAREARRHRMQLLVQQGLQSTQVAFSAKDNIDSGMQAVVAIRGAMEAAVKTCPPAAIAWVGVCFGLEILTNPVSEAVSNREGLAYVLSSMKWYWELARLLLDENQSQDQRRISGLRDALRGRISTLYQQILAYEMRCVCLYHRTALAVILRDTIKLDDWDSQLMDVKAAEHAVRESSTQFNSESLKLYLESLEQAAKGQKAELCSILSAIQVQTRQQEKTHRDEKDDMCIRDLRETDPRDDKTRIESAKGGLLRDVYHWILVHPDFVRFRDRTAESGNLLWVKGDPGKGKTMLLCGMIDHLQQRPGATACYFFCQATEARLSNATAVLRGLIYSIVSAKRSLISYVRERWDHAGRSLFEDGNSWEALSKILRAMLTDPVLNNLTLVIDALDECYTDRDRLVNFISETTQAKWIVSSRNWPEIDEMLQQRHDKAKIHLELNETSVSQAVSAFIQIKVERLAESKKYDDEIRTKIEHYLIANAHGTFLWVALVCQRLSDPKTRPRHVNATLQSSPPGLDAFYERMMDQISESLDAALCNKILGIASMVYRPLSLSELRTLLRSKSDDNELRDIVESCGSFLTLQQDSVYFVHQSAKDYLLEQGSRRIFPSSRAALVYDIYSASLNVLSQTLHRNMYALGSVGILFEEISTPSPDPLASVRYACTYWAAHACDLLEEATTTDLDKGGQLYNFLITKFLYWLESLALMGTISSGVGAIQRMWSTMNSCTVSEITVFIRDARRFILTHRQAIEIAPLQAYVTALIFSPTSSIVRNTFKEEEPDWIELISGTEQDWDEYLQILGGYTEQLAHVAFSPDGRYLASTGGESIQVWEVSTGSLMMALKSGDRDVRRAVFSPDGRTLVSIWKASIMSWDTATWSLRQTHHLDDEREPWSLCFSSTGQRLALGCNESTIMILDANLTCLSTIQAQAFYDDIECVAFSPDDDRLGAGVKKTIQTWDLFNNASSKTFLGHHRDVTSIAFSSDNRLLASGSLDETIKIWDVHSGQSLWTLRGHGRAIWSIDMYRSDLVVSASTDSQIKIWDLRSGECLKTLDNGSPLSSAAFSPDGQGIASGSDNGLVKLWELNLQSNRAPRSSETVTYPFITLSSDGHRLATMVPLDDAINIWDTGSGSNLRTVQTNVDWTTSAILSANGHLMAISTWGSIEIWDVGSGTMLNTIPNKIDMSQRQGMVTFSPDGSLIAVIPNTYHGIDIWRVSTASLLKTVGDCRYICMSFSPGGQRISSVRSDGNVDIWDISSGGKVQTVQISPMPCTVVAVALSFDERFLVSLHEGCIQILDRSSGTFKETIDPDLTFTPEQLEFQGFRTSWMTFRTPNFSRLMTNVGVLSLDTPSTGAIPELKYVGYRLTAKRSWVVKDGVRLLWIPPKYRDGNSAVAGSLVGFGCSSGPLLLMRLSYEYSLN